MTIITLSVVTAICAVCLTIGCNPTEGKRDSANLTPPRAIRDVLLGDLRLSARRTTSPFAVQESLTVFDVEWSRAISGLSYNWARYAAPEPQHAYIGAVAAARGREYRVVKNAGDWWATIGAWQPTDGNNVAQACLELHHVLHDGNPDGMSTFLAQKRAVSIWVDSAQLRRLHEVPDDTIHIEPPTSPDGIWQVTAWILVAGPLLAGRYRCTIPAAGDGSGIPQLILIDSIAETNSGS